MMTFNAAMKAFKNGIEIRSIVTKKIYSKGKRDIAKANKSEIDGFWCKYS